jgi:TPR repeat protein
MRMVIIAAMTAVLALPCPAIAGGTALIPALERLADAGNAEAIYHLGMAYQTGSGVTEDHARALAAFRKAQALGDPLASYKLGCYFAGQGAGLVNEDLALALKYKLVAAEAGYSLAQFDVGLLHGRSGDPAAARQWIERSAAQGFTQGLMILSVMYNGAPGIDRDAAKTAAYFRLALARLQPNDKQTAWLADFESRLSPDDRSRADEIVRNYQPAPTPLTRKALAGQGAAQALVDNR